MDKGRKNLSLKIIGIILIVLGIIIFIVSTIQLSEVQNTTTHWAEGFMQDYQARTNATNSIPCYMFMMLSVIMVIVGIILVVIKPRASVVVVGNTQISTETLTDNQNNVATNYCTNCGSKVSSDYKFCKECGHSLK